MNAVTMSQRYEGFMHTPSKGTQLPRSTSVPCTPKARVCRRAAEQGHASAQSNLGVKYAKGEGVPQDAAEAVKWFRRAAEQGHAGAQSNLGVNYANGEGVPQDLAEAVKWYRRAAEQGHAVAQTNLGVKYATGEGVPHDYVRAYAWLNLAAAQGHKQVIKAKDFVRSKMSSDQIARAQELSATLFARIKQSQ